MADLFVSAVTGQDEGPRGILSQRLLRLLYPASVDVPLDELKTHVHCVL